MNRLIRSVAYTLIFSALGSHLAYANIQTIEPIINPQITNAKATTIKQIIGLVQANEQMNLKAVAQAIHEPELYDHFDMSGVNDSGYFYEIKKKNHALASVRYRIKVDSSNPYHYVYGEVIFGFKQKHCPSILEIEHLTGQQVQSATFGTSPDLITGKGGEYTIYYLQLGEKTVNINPILCEISILTSAKLS